MKHIPKAQVGRAVIPCAGCGAPVIWASSPVDGAQSAVDATPSPSGTHCLTTQRPDITPMLCRPIGPMADHPRYSPHRCMTAPDLEEVS